MPKRKLPLGEILVRVEVPARQFQDEQVHINNEIDVKIESSNVDSDFDGMQYESTKMVAWNDTINVDPDNIDTATHETETDPMKMEYDVKTANTFRPDMLENLNELAYILPANVSDPDKENTQEIVENETMQSAKRNKKQKKKTKRNEKQNLPRTTRQKSQAKQHTRQGHNKQKPFSCDYCIAKFSFAQGLNLLKKENCFISIVFRLKFYLYCLFFMVSIGFRPSQTHRISSQ